MASYHASTYYGNHDTLRTTSRHASYSPTSSYTLDRLTINEPTSTRTHKGYSTSNSSYGSQYSNSVSPCRANFRSPKERNDYPVDKYSFRARTNIISPREHQRSTLYHTTEHTPHYGHTFDSTNYSPTRRSLLSDDLSGRNTAVGITAHLTTNSDIVSPTSVFKRRDYGLSSDRFDSGDQQTKGNVGLENLGNTCFMNSALQCLLNTNILIDYMNGNKMDEDRLLSKGKGELIAAYKDLVHRVWDTLPPKTLAPENLKTAVQRFTPRFSGYLQQDCQEFLRYFLLGLHEDLNKVTSKPKHLKLSKEHERAEKRMSHEEKSVLYWEKYLTFDNSAIVDIFVGQLKSTLECQSCGYESVTFDPFWDLSLPIPKDTSEVSLRDCLLAFTKKETLGGEEKPMCEQCKTRQTMTKGFLIQKFPKVLVLHLKRFNRERYKSKLSTLVKFETGRLNLSPFASNKGTTAMYNLYGVCNHVGSVYSGHYTAFCKHPYKQKWYQYDDSRVSRCSEDRIVSDEAYVLFYELVD